MKNVIQRAFSFFGKGGKAKRPNTQMQTYQNARAARFDLRDSKRYIIDSTEYSRQDFKFLELRVPELARLGVLGTATFPHFRELQIDAFEWFYRGAPRQKSQQEYYADFDPHNAIMSIMNGMAEFRSLKGRTIRNKLTSLIATKKLNDIIDTLKSDQPEMVNQIASSQRSGEDARQASKRLDTFRQMWKEADEAGNEETKKHLEEMGAELAVVVEESREEADADATKAMESIENNGDAIRDAIRQGLSEAEATAEGVEATMDSMSFGRGAGKTRKLNEERLIEMSERIQNDAGLQMIAKIAGRIKQIIAKKSQTHSSDYGEVIETELGSDVSRMIGPELAMLADEDLGMDLIRRLYDEQVTVWSKESTESLGRGPIVCAVDCSGSMDGSRIYWAKAIACALYGICKDRNQPFTFIQYSRSVDAKTFNGDADDDLNFMAMLQRFEGGGTYYDRAWAEIIRTFDEERNMSKADVVFISDEEFPVDQFPDEMRRFNEALVATKAQCFGISLTSRDYARPLSAFKNFCNAAWEIDPDRPESDEQCIEEMFTDNLCA